MSRGTWMVLGIGEASGRLLEWHIWSLGAGLAIMANFEADLNPLSPVL